MDWCEFIINLWISIVELWISLINHGYASWKGLLSLWPLIVGLLSSPGFGSFNDLGPFQKRFFSFFAIQFLVIKSQNNCKCHDSIAVVSLAKLCDWFIRNGMRAKWICQRIWNKIKKSLTKCVLDPSVFFEVCYNFLFSNLMLMKTIMMIMIVIIIVMILIIILMIMVIMMMMMIMRIMMMMMMMMIMMMMMMMVMMIIMMIMIIM